MRTAGIHEATLTFEVWDDNNVSDDMMGQISYRLSELNVAPNVEGAEATTRTDALEAGEGGEAGGDFGTLTSIMLGETAEQRAARVKSKEYLYVTVDSCAGLKDLETVSTSDPFVKVIL